ncbi:ParB/RepB/Spo0J family partition protein [Vibrio tasmaniensis]|nr:ParB/RepB/Spo0J family partition protein [Vibrio tasmaniensis]
MNNKLGNLNKLSSIAKAVKEGSKGGMLTVHPDECYVEEQVRTKFDLEALEELGTAISEEGQTSPCVVFPKDERGYRIYNGERRWRSIKLKELQSIKIVVDPDLKLEEFNGEQVMPLSVKVGQASDNINRDDLTPFEIAQLIQELMAEPYKLKKGDIAKKFGKSAPWTSRHVKLLDAPESVIALCESGLMMDAETLSQLTKLHEKSPSACDMLIKNGQYQRKNAEEALRSIKRNEETLSHVKETDEDLKRVLDTWECNILQNTAGPNVTDFIKMIYVDHVIDNEGNPEKLALEALIQLVQKADMPLELRPLRVEHGLLEDSLKKPKESKKEKVHNTELGEHADSVSYPHGEYLLSIDSEISQSIANNELEQMDANLSWVIDSLGIKDTHAFLDENKELFAENIKSLLSYSDLLKLLENKTKKTEETNTTEAVKVNSEKPDTNNTSGWEGENLVFNGLDLGKISQAEAIALIELLNKKFGGIGE